MKLDLNQNLNELLNVLGNDELNHVNGGINIRRPKPIILCIYPPIMIHPIYML